MILRIAKTVAVILIFIIPVLAYSQGWYQQSVSAGNNQLNDAFAVSLQTCFIASGYIQDLATNVFTVFRTTNRGMNWLAIATGTGYFFTCAHFTDSLTGFMGGGATVIMPEQGYGKCIYKTTNGGANWFAVYYMMMFPGGSPIEIKDLHFVNALTGWACGLDSYIAKTTNGGTNFINYNTPNFFRKYSVFFSDPLTGWISGDSGRICKSTNGGVNWLYQTTSVTATYNSIFFLNTNTGYACGTNGVLIKTTNGGSNWNLLSTGTAANLRSVKFKNSDMGWIAGTNILLATSNGGLNWNQQFTGTAGLSSVFMSDSLNGWACGGNKIYGTLTGGWTGLKNFNTGVPDEFSMSQNYPNPFNNTSNLKFEIANLGDVKLVVYDVMGREVQTLVNEELQPGTYEVTFDANGLNSGVYFYKLTTGDYTATKRMVLVK